MKLQLLAFATILALSSHAYAKPEPTLVQARTRVDEFMREELARRPNPTERIDLATIRRWCTTELSRLLEIEMAREQAFYEGFEAAEPKPGRHIKPLFADRGYFLKSVWDCEMGVIVAEATRKGKTVEVPVTFTCTENGQLSELGSQTMILEVEAGEWRIADIRFDKDTLLSDLLKRPKFMDRSSREGE